MHPDWIGNSKWKSKWKKYSINQVSSLQVLEILSRVELPDGLLENNTHLVNLYQQLLNFHKYHGYSERKKFINELFFAKIFPMESGRFGSLKNKGGNKGQIFWMSNRTRRTSGLEGSIDLNMISTEYTYTPQISPDSSEEKKKATKEITNRNELVRQMLRLLEVPELNDDRILSEIQVPFLLRRESKWTHNLIKKKYQVFNSIFEVYRGKRSYDDGYLKSIARLSEAYVLGENGKLKRMYQTILPEKVRLFEEDHLYASSGLDSLRLPHIWYEPNLQGENLDERYEAYLNQLRGFLIHCGVANGPKFQIKERKFSNASELREADELLYWA